MPGEEINTTLRFDADISDFSGAMQEARRAAALAKSEFNSVSSEMDDWSKSSEGLTAKLKQLSAAQQVEERKLKILESAYEKVVKEQGENSKAAVDLKTKINNQKAAVNKATKEHNKFAKKLEEVEEGADDAADDVKAVGKAAKDAGEEAKDAGGGWTIFKDVIADMISNVISGAIDMIKNAAEATREYRREIALMAQNASDSGVDMGAMKEAVADVGAVTGDTGAAMEGLNMLMASGLNTDDIVFAADALSGAAIKFDGVSFEGMAEGLQETLATGQAVGPFAELIERTGGNLDDFNAGLAGCTTAAERQQFVMSWLANSGLKDVHDGYAQNNSDLVEAEKAQIRANDAMAGIGAAIEPIQTRLSNIGSTILEKITPVVTSIVQWVMDNLPIIEPIVIALAVALGVLAAALGIQGLIAGVQQAFALLNTTILANPIVLIVAAIAGLVAAFIYLWNNCEGFREFFVGLWEGIKNAVSVAVDWIVEAFNNVVTWVKELPGKISSAISGAIARVKAWGVNLYNTAKTKVSEVVSGVTTWFKQLPGKISTAISSAVASIKAWGVNLYNTAKTKISEVVSGVVTWFKQLPGKISSAISGAITSIVTWGTNLVTKGKTAASNLVTSIVTGVSGLPGKLLTVGKNLVSGLWNGISGSFTWIKQKITGWVGNVLSFIKNLFGIHSPSTETEWQGEMLVAGYVNALKNGRQKMAEAMQGLAKSGLDALNGGAPEIGMSPGAGGKQVVFYQTNNSPKALSRAEIYRQTHNALSFVGGM